MKKFIWKKNAHCLMLTGLVVFKIFSKTAFFRLVQNENETHEEDVHVLCGHNIKFAEFVKYII